MTTTTVVANIILLTEKLNSNFRTVSVSSPHRVLIDAAGMAINPSININIITPHLLCSILLL